MTLGMTFCEPMHPFMSCFLWIPVLPAQLTLPLLLPFHFVTNMQPIILWCICPPCLIWGSTGYWWFDFEIHPSLLNMRFHRLLMICFLKFIPLVVSIAWWVSVANVLCLLEDTTDLSNLGTSYQDTETLKYCSFVQIEEVTFFIALLFNCILLVPNGHSCHRL